MMSISTETTKTRRHNHNSKTYLNKGRIKNNVPGGPQDQLHWYSDGPVNVKMVLVQ